MGISLRDDELALTEVGDEVVLLCMRSATYFSTNAAGGSLLRRLREGPATRDQLVARLSGEYGLRAVDVAADVDSFLDELREARLLAA